MAQMTASDADVRQAIKDALSATNAFGPDSIWLSGLPEDYGQAASDLTAAAIQPDEGADVTQWDAGYEDIGRLETETVVVTLLARNQDPELCDKLASQLLAYLKNAVNGQCLAGITIPDKTHVEKWKWLPVKTPERRIRAIIQYQSLPVGWDADNTSE